MTSWNPTAPPHLLLSHPLYADVSTRPRLSRWLQSGPPKSAAPPPASAGALGWRGKVLPRCESRSRLSSCTFDTTSVGAVYEFSGFNWWNSQESRIIMLPLWLRPPGHGLLVASLPGHHQARRSSQVSQPWWAPSFFPIVLGIAYSDL
jgi:hypothetical protein